MNSYEIRTDLALENREIYQKASKMDEEVPGIETNVDNSSKNMLITTVKITTESGAKALNKPIGEYITIESSYMNDEVEAIDQEVIQTVARTIKKVSHMVKNDSVLVVGLGNTDVTPDALGPKVIDNLFITRHLKKYAPELLEEDVREVSGIVPGVLGTTGIETSDVIKGVVKEIKPDLILVVDALAAKELNRISKTIQVSNVGITPGSGVKNNRSEISQKTLGIPVIAIGVPTVVGIPTIINDAISYVRENLPEADNALKEKNYMQDILENKKFDFMVTPNTIDDIITNLSRILSEGINEALR